MATNSKPVSVVRLLCKLCNTAEPSLTSPRRLACGHVFCRPCLVKAKPEKCPTCERNLPAAMVVDDLPVDFGPNYSCGACSKKGRALLAKLYCRECNQRLCEVHLEVRRRVLYKKYRFYELVMNLKTVSP